MKKILGGLLIIISILLFLMSVFTLLNLFTPLSAITFDAYQIVYALGCLLFVSAEILLGVFSFSQGKKNDGKS